MNSSVEQQEQSNLLGTDFYRTMKVDNHIHAAAAPSAKLFVNFVRSKLDVEGDTVVYKKAELDPTTGATVLVEKTLAQVYQDAGLDTDHLTIDAFNVLADYSVYQRFDNFNDKYSPFKLADMRRIFLKTTNEMHGRYFAELLKHVLSRHEQNKGHNSACEMRLSIYGMERHEWYDLACWLLTEWDHPEQPGVKSNMISTQNKWLIQVPRLWRIYSMKPTKSVDDANQRSFQEMLENLFVPMFEATLHPDQHPEIAAALLHIVGVDSVDDEGALEEPCGTQRPLDWTTSSNPSYAWQLYYIWANLQVLNRLRSARGLNTFGFRPHAGETGDPMHLAATYMLCDGINHGIVLDAQVSLQYLYYLDQVGMTLSPLSNNFLFTKIADNPFAKFFRRGLNVTLSTDDPLLFHLSDDALLEEYSVARATFNLSMVDMMEIARNSVKQSGFDESFKEEWLGKNYRRGLTFCDERITHVPLIRAKFRGKGDAVLQEMMVQFGLARDAHRDVLFENFEEVPTFPERSQL
jgi:AMP deaminase